LPRRLARHSFSGGGSLELSSEGRFEHRLLDVLETRRRDTIKLSAVWDH